MEKIKLVLFFTKGISLRIWSEIGMLEREVELYKALLKNGVDVSFVTYGDACDLLFQNQIPGITILCNRWNFPIEIYETLIPILFFKHLKQADIYKSNQSLGSNVALRSASQ